MREQLANAVALIELDGVARRLVLCTPDLAPEQLAGCGRIAHFMAADDIKKNVAGRCTGFAWRNGSYLVWNDAGRQLLRSPAGSR